MSTIRFVGLDVHADTISVAVAEPNGEVRSLGVFRNRPDSVRRLVTRLGPASQLRVCYEAGPTGYGLYWQFTGLGVTCAVIAPTLAPTKAGDRVKTNRRDAEKLARCHRAGDLTPVWVPDAAHEVAIWCGRARTPSRINCERVGRDQYRGRCPLHRGEGADAFHANLSRNLFQCFSCGAGGTVLDCVAAMEHCTLPEAARKLAAQQPERHLRAPTRQNHWLRKREWSLSRSGLCCAASPAAIHT